MKYISLSTWRDLKDGHLYHEGDEFPFDGREVSPERIAELETGVNRAGLKLIRADEASIPEDQKAQNVPGDAENDQEQPSKPKAEGKPAADVKKPKTASKTAGTKPKAKK